MDSEQTLIVFSQITGGIYSMKIRGLVLAGALTVLSGASSAVNALIIDVATTDLGSSMWRYSYTLSGATFNVNDGFTIYFDYTLYGALSNPATANADWDVLAVDPVASSSSDGFFDGLALSVGASVTDPFTVDFAWLGSGIPPGEQFFETYTCVGQGQDPCDAIEITGEGTTGGTGAVPVPATWALLAAGLMGFRMRRLASSGVYARWALTRRSGYAAPWARRAMEGSRCRGAPARFRRGCGFLTE